MSDAPDRLPLNALRVFEAVATHLSFTAAARELGVTTAAVSAQVKSLEADIGVALFRRHTRAVALTQEGAELLPGVRRGLDELRRAVDRIRRERVGGMLNLSVPSEFLQRWLLPRSGEFTRQHPEIEVRFGPARAALDFSRDDFHAAIRLRQRPVAGPQGRAAARRVGVPGVQPGAAGEARPDRDAGGLRTLPAAAQRLRAVGALAAARRRRHLPRRDGADARGRLGHARGRRAGQGRRAGALVAGGGGARGRPAGPADDAERAAAQRVVPDCAAGALLAAQGRAVPRLAARLLPRVSRRPTGETLAPE